MKAASAGRCGTVGLRDTQCRERTVAGRKTADNARGDRAIHSSKWAQVSDSGRPGEKGNTPDQFEPRPWYAGCWGKQRTNNPR